MEAPEPIYIRKEKIISQQSFIKPSAQTKKKEYILSLDNISYKLIISYNKNDINFTIEKNKEILLYNYIYNYKYNKIVSILKLPSEIYDDSNKIIDLIDNAYENKKIGLKFNDKKTGIFLVIKIIIGFKEIECPIKMQKNDYNIDTKFEVILNEMKSLRQNKNILIDSQLLELEKAIQLLKESVKDKLKESLTFINELKQKIEDNTKILKNNKNEI